MESEKTAYTTIDEYIALYPAEVQMILNEVRAVIKAAAPEAQETIKYRMPTFTLKGNLIHFAAFKNHIGVYPTPSGTEKFKKELSPYEGSKGAIRFPLGKPIPYDLISQIVHFRVKENLERAEAKAKKKKQR